MQKQKIGLQCHITTPWRVKILHDNQIDFNENKYGFKYLNDVPPWDDCLPYEYIDAEVEKRLKKNKGQLTGDEMEKETKHYLKSLKSWSQLVKDNYYWNW